MTNKKVKNATPTTCNGIEFRSKFEATVYNTLIQNGFNPLYEHCKYILWEGFKPTVPFYARNNVVKPRKLVNITYTPDFYMEYEGLKILIEAKGKTNDVFPYKFKMFRKCIEEKPDKDSYLIFEIFTKKQLLESINIIRNHATIRKNKESVG